MRDSPRTRGATGIILRVSDLASSKRPRFIRESVASVLRAASALFSAASFSSLVTHRLIDPTETCHILPSLSLGAKSGGR